MAIRMLESHLNRSCKTFHSNDGRKNGFYGVYENDAWLFRNDADFTVTAHPTLTASTPTLEAASRKYVQNVNWNIDGITDAILDKVVIMASYDGGQTWSELSEESSSTGNTTVTLPWNADKVRYRIMVYPKDDFKMVVTDDTPWVSADTPDYALTPIQINGTLSIDNVRSNFTDATDVYARTYSPTLTWNIPTVLSSVVDKVSVQYCTKDMGSDWQELFNTTKLSGTQAVTLPVGIDSLLFRMVITPSDDQPQFQGNSVSNTLTAAIKYEPVFSQIAVNGTVGANYDATAQTYTPTLAYTMNDDLWQTRLGKAFVYYSTDEGATWTLAKTVDSPAQSGELQVTVPADAKKYQFRIGVASAVNNAINCGVEESSNVYAYTKSYVLDDNVDYTPETISAGEVKVLRSFVNGRMGTVCLPFALTTDQITEGFGENAEVYEYTSLNGTTMDFSKVTEMEAGKPYLVKTAADKEYLLFSNVNITEGAKLQPSEISSDYVFTGTFSPYLMAVDHTELFLTANGALKYPSSSENNANRLRGYRGYFKLANANSSETKISFDGETTGIDNIDLGGDQPIRVYNLNGQYFGDSLKGLTKGVYVVNGKKVIVD